MPVQPGMGQESEEQPTGGKAIVTIKFLVDKEKLKKVVESASGSDDDDESGQGSKPGMPR